MVNISSRYPEVSVIATNSNDLETKPGRFS